MLLEPRLGYTHKGSEKLFEDLSITDGVRLSEKISGDSSFSHSLAFCQTIEQLGQVVVPERAQYLRVILQSWNDPPITWVTLLPSCWMQASTLVDLRFKTA